MFSSALLRPERETPSLIAGPKGKGVVKRYNVYRNNVTVSLIEALAATFPAVRRITGEEFFRAMARFHIRDTPPNSALLFEYGRDFPAFIAAYEYAQDMPWLADVARIERAWLDAYHAADAEPLSPSALAAVPAERLADLVFIAHPAARIIRSRFAAVTIFAANRVTGSVRHDRCRRARGRAGHAAGIRGGCSAFAGGRGRVSLLADRRRTAWRSGRRGSASSPFVRYRGRDRRHDRGRRIDVRGDWRPLMSAMEQRAAVGDRLHSVAVLVDRASHWVRFIAQPSLVQLVLRFALAVPFWRSGILKWDGFLQLNDTAVTLFTDEFKLHLPGGPYPFPAPTVMAFLSGCGEITFPMLLVFGLGARFAALGLLFMTLIVELTVPDGWPIHITWAAMALAIMAYGAGRLSLDHLLERVAGPSR